MINKSAIYCCIFLVVMFTVTSYAPSCAEEKISARIIVNHKPNGVVEIKPICLAKQPMKIFYALDLIKQGSRGNNISRQSGSILLQPNQEAVLCKIVIKMNHTSGCQAQLKIFYRGGLIFRDKIDIRDKSIKDSI